MKELKDEISRLHAENAALQQGYDAARLEIDHLRGVTKSKLLAQPVAWMVYLPSIDTQHLYYSQEDMGYVDDVTNHADAEVTPLYEMAAPKVEVAPAGEYPPLPTPDSYLFQHEETGVTQYVDSQQVEWGLEKNNPRLQRIGGAFTEAQMRAYVDTDRAMRAQADSQPALPEITAEDRSFLHYNPNTDDVVDWVHHYASAAIAADRASRAPTSSVLEDATLLERERICAAIKAEDDYCVDQGNYMLDSDDCIKIVRGEWVRPNFAIDAARKQGASHD